MWAMSLDREAVGVSAVANGVTADSGEAGVGAADSGEAGGVAADSGEAGVTAAGWDEEANGRTGTAKRSSGVVLEARCQPR